MLLQSFVRLVGKRACYQAGPTMLQMDRKYTTEEHEKITFSTAVNEEYEKSIKALNTLQSNAATLRRSIENDSKNSQLENTIKYLNRSGISVEDLKKLSVIHVSGTKGKGSTCALTESILRAHGFKTGFFSSPHLMSVTERIRLNGQPISKQKYTQTFWNVFNRLEKSRDHADDMPPYFKFLTILSFHIFLEERVDVAVLEVGIGGELDSTNVVSHTKTVGITSLGLEHTQLLGNTIEAIAWQKAGIIKPNSNVYTTVTRPECLSIIKQRAAEKNATLYIVPELSQYVYNDESRRLLSNLNKVIQLNGSLAIQLSYDWIRNNRSGYGFGTAPNTTLITPSVIEGLSNCSWPGRCQIVNVGNFRIHFDGAHTAESMNLCGSWFKKSTLHSKTPKIIIFNITGERDSRKLLDILRQKNDFDLACFVPNIPSGRLNNTDNMSVFTIAAQVKRAKIHADNWRLLCQDNAGLDNGRVFGSIVDIFYFVRQKFGIVQEVDLLVTGSLHLIGAAMLAMDEFKRRLQQTDICIQSRHTHP